VKPVLLVTVLLLSMQGHAQSGPDSLRAVLEISTGKTRVEVLEKLVKQLRYSSREQAWNYAKEAIALSAKEKLAVESERIYTLMGSMKRFEGIPDTARYYFEKAHAIALTLDDPYLIADGLNNIGTTYQNQGNLIQAANYYTRALAIAEEKNNPKQLALAYNNLGFVYKMQKHYDQALEHFKKSLNLRLLLNDSLGVAGCYNNIGMIHMSQEEFTEAKHWYAKSLAFLNETRHIRELSMLYNNLGVTYENEGNLEEGRRYYFKSIDYKTRLNDERGLASTYGNMADNYLEDKNPKEAIRYATMSMALASKTSSLEYAITATKILAHAYEDLGDFKNAFYHHVQHKKFQDSLFNESKSRQIAELAAKYESEKKERENASLKISASLQKSKLNKQQLIIAGIAGTLGIVLLTLTFFYQQYKRSKALALALEKQKMHAENTNTQLHEVLMEKNNVLNIMAHDLRSPMNKVLGLTHIIKSEGPLNDQQALCLKMISDVADQGRRIINDLLLVNREGAVPLKFSVFNVNHFLQEMVQQYVAEAHRKTIDLRLKLPGDEISISSDRNALFRILDNLISNAIKFSPHERSVTVQAEVVEQRIRLSIADEGPGFTEADRQNLFLKFKRLSAQPTGGESSTGLGLAIVKNLVDLLGGEISLQTKAGAGSTFILSFPVHHVGAMR
jgi:signal transduction histidine kinase/Tfp pilus assembly protein PilF